MQCLHVFLESYHFRQRMGKKVEHGHVQIKESNVTQTQTRNRLFDKVPGSQERWRKTREDDDGQNSPTQMVLSEGF